MEQRKILTAIRRSLLRSLVEMQNDSLYKSHSAEISKRKITAMTSRGVDYAHTCSAFGDPSIAF